MAKDKIIESIKEIFVPKKAGKISLWVQPDPGNDPEYFSQVENSLCDLEIIALSQSDAESILDSLNKL
jgi:hypothetical protein